ncbi:MAG: hypothetical protein LBG93_07615 [Treponema sp.]|jgi:hypothetical protein|nr:hypothetical protein [Treponema sp.]
MQTFDSLKRLSLDVTIDGAPIEDYPSSFYLVTDDGFPHVIARLQFPKDVEAGEAGDPVTVNMVSGDDSCLLFTGEIYSVSDHGAYRDLTLTDGFKKLCDTDIAASYRKEMATVILQDTLDDAGIEDTDITCPEVEIARFSTEKIPADKIIKLLIKTLEEHGHSGLRFFFDDKDVFRFGTPEDSGINEGEVFVFETGKNIIRAERNRIETLPFPIRHSQEVIVDGKTFVTKRTELLLSNRRSRLVLWLGRAS